jgi:hypothetical protein
MLVKNPQSVIWIAYGGCKLFHSSKFKRSYPATDFAFFVFLIPTMSSAIRRKGAITDALRAVPHYCASKLPTLVSKTPAKDTKSKHKHDQKQGNRVDCLKACPGRVRWCVGDLSFWFVFKSNSSVFKKAFQGQIENKFGEGGIETATI